MRWNVEGADAQTGVEQSWMIDADDEREAEKKARRRGILVAAVRKSAQPPPAGALNTMIGSALRSKSGNNGHTQPIVPVAATLANGGASVATHVRTPAYAPTYTGLRVSAVLLLILAILSYGIGAMLIVLAATADTAPDGAMAKFLALAPALGCLVGGVVMHTLSIGANVLREIARRVA
jgi:hypothetical protein